MGRAPSSIIGQAEGQSQQQLLAFGSGSLLLYTVPLSKKALPSLTVPQSSCLSYRLCFYCWFQNKPLPFPDQKSCAFNSALETLKVEVPLLSTINSPGSLWHLAVTFSSNKERNLDRKQTNKKDTKEKKKGTKKDNEFWYLWEKIISG